MTKLMFALATTWMLSTTILTNTSLQASAGDAILIEFSSSRCAPCQAMKPVLAQLESQGVPVRHVDVNSEPAIASRYGIRQTPTFVVVSGSKEVTRLVGTQTLAQLQSALATSTSGPLVPTLSATRSFDSIEAPQTRLAPIPRRDPRYEPGDQRQTLTASPPARDQSFGDEAYGEAMPSMSVADAAERAQAATVRLRVHDGHGYGAGTGTIIDTHGDSALVLTCGHLFRENKGEGKIEVDLFVGGEVRTVLGQVVDYDADSRDVALVEIRPGFAVQPVRILSASETPRNGQTVFSFGCDRGDDPSRRDTRITGINTINQHLGASNVEIAGAPIDGRSGGGLFDAEGRLIGVCNSADYKNDVGIYAGPGAVQWQLDRVNLARLYQADSPVDRIAATPSAPQASPAASRIASVPQNDSAIQLTAGNMDSSQEVIVIVRDRDNPSGTPKVMTLQDPSADLMQMIQRHSR